MKKTKKKSADPVYVRGKRVLFRANSGGDISIISLDDLDFYYTIDSWAAELWKLIDGRTPLSQIEAQIAKRSGLNDKIVHREAVKVVRDLLKSGLISEVVK